MAWGVRKTVRRNATRSYTGSTWEEIGVQRDQIPLSFRTRGDAAYWARELTKRNPVGFEPFELEDRT